MAFPVSPREFKIAGVSCQTILWVFTTQGETSKGTYGSFTVQFLPIGPHELYTFYLGTYQTETDGIRPSVRDSPQNSPCKKERISDDVCSLLAPPSRSFGRSRRRPRRGPCDKFARLWGAPLPHVQWLSQLHHVDGTAGEKEKGEKGKIEDERAEKYPPSPLHYPTPPHHLRPAFVTGQHPLYPVSTDGGRV